MNGAVAISDKADAVFDVQDTLGCQTSDDSDVVVSHELGQWFKLWVHMKVSDGKSCQVVKSKGGVETFAEQSDGLVDDVANCAK